MNIESFAKELTQYIRQYGIEPKQNPFLQDLQQLGSDLPKFYNSVNQKYLKDYVQYRNSGEIECNDPKLLASKDFWNQPDRANFLYVSKVLPMMKKQYPAKYKKVFDGDNITKPAGFHPKGSAEKNDANADTIWNYVASIEGNPKDTSGSEKSSGSNKTVSSKQLDKFLNNTSRATITAKNFLNKNKDRFSTEDQRANALNRYLKYVLDNL